MVFYIAYSNYMHDLIRKEEDIANDSERERTSENFQLSHDLESAISLMEELYSQNKLHFVNKYVLGLTKIMQNKREETIQLLVEILNENPFFWSCWLDLQKLLINTEGIDSYETIGKINNHWMKNFYTMTLLLDDIKNHINYELYCFKIGQGMLIYFQNSTFLLSILGSLFHDIQKYDYSLVFFQVIMDMDPFRYEQTDIISNILYVKGNLNELGKLAIICFENDKYIPETCCVLGNFYSSMGDHINSAKYFQRAIQLNRNFLAAYTLLGHELLELKNE